MLPESGQNRKRSHRLTRDSSTVESCWIKAEADVDVEEDIIGIQKWVSGDRYGIVREICCKDVSGCLLS